MCEKQQKKKIKKIKKSYDFLKSFNLSVVTIYLRVINSKNLQIPLLTINFSFIVYNPLS